MGESRYASKPPPPLVGGSAGFIGWRSPSNPREREKKRITERKSEIVRCFFFSFAHREGNITSNVLSLSLSVLYSFAR